MQHRLHKKESFSQIPKSRSRYGLDGKLIDFGRCCEVETRSPINEIMKFIAPEAQELGSDREMAHIERIMREGRADRQLAAWEARHDVKDVVGQIVGETYKSLEINREKRPSFSGAA